MNDSRRSSLSQRRYRVAQALTVAGSLAVGVLVVDRLVAAFYEQFNRYYGVDQDTVTVLDRASAGSDLGVTALQLVIAVLALVSVVSFVGNERRRLRQSCDLSSACSRGRRAVVVSRLSPRVLFESFVVRSSVFAGALLSMWLLQASLEYWMQGAGLGLELSSWLGLLPLASVFGVCVLGGMLAAGVSLFGLRAIHVLQIAFNRVVRRRQQDRLVRRIARGRGDAIRTFRELLGCDILSRPPPVAV